MTIYTILLIVFFFTRFQPLEELEVHKKMYLSISVFSVQYNFKATE